MIRILEKKECCGCKACAEICPKHCIKWDIDNEGFGYPEVDLETCINCGLCEKVCPELSKPHGLNRSETPEALSVRANSDEDRLISTSGGVFPTLARYFFRKGAWVGGAIYSEDFVVKSLLTNKEEDLPVLQSSKYIQNDPAHFYSEVKEKLDNGENVFVCSTPCQIAALYKFLRKPYSNLYTCEVVCMGVPSYKLLNSYITHIEKETGKKVHDFKFKFKDINHPWGALANRITFEDGTCFVINGDDDKFMRVFLESRLSMRPSCFDCKYKAFPRAADLTIGDFWGIEKIESELKDKWKGYSIVMVNSDKGKKMIESCRSEFSIAEYPLHVATEGNPYVWHSVAPVSGVCDDDRKFFYQKIDAGEDVWSNERSVRRPIFIRKFKGGINLIKKIVNILQNRRVWTEIKLNKGKLCKVTRKANNLKIALRKKSELQLSTSSEIEVNALLMVGFGPLKKTIYPTRIKMESNCKLVVNGDFSIVEGCYVWISRGATLTLNGGFINEGARIYCASGITIGKNANIATEVIIRDFDGHYIDSNSFKMAKPINIQDNVWIGCRAMILKGVTIGEGAVVAANAVVTKDVPPHTLVAGNPAKVIRENVYWRKSL